MTKPIRNALAAALSAAKAFVESAVLGFAFMACFGSNVALAGPVAGSVAALSYSATNVSTSAYTTIYASTPTSAGRLEVCDTSGKIIKLAIGAAGSEIDLATAAVSGCVVLGFNYGIAPGSRLSIRAIDAAATTGYNVTSLLP